MTTTITLREGDFSSFFEVPFAIYPKDTLYVSPFKRDLQAMLDPKKNPFFARGEASFFTAHRDGQPVGRILCHVFHPSNDLFNERTGCFGFFDCIDDLDVARTLLDRAEAYNRSRGMTRLRGNMNMTAGQEMGVVVDGFDRRPYLAQVYNPPHIPKLLSAAGFSAVYPMTTFVSQPLAGFDPERCLLPRHRELLADPAFRFRTVSMRHFSDEVERVREVLNDAMLGNHLFVPLTQAEMAFQLEPFAAIADPELVWIAEHNGEPVGATLCAPDVLPLLARMKSRITPWSLWTFLRGRRRLKTASIIIIVVKKAYQARGIIGGLNYMLMRSLKQRGYDTVGGTWIADSNRPSLKQVALLDMVPHHRVDLFEKAL